MFLLLLFNFYVIVRCVCCFVGASGASDYPYTSHDSSFSSSFFPIMFLLCDCDIYFYCCFLLLILLIFLLLCFFPLVTSVILPLVPFFSPSFGSSCLFVLAIGFSVLIPPLSHLCFLFFPLLRAHLRKINGRTSISFYWPMGFLAKNFVALLILWSSCLQSMFVSSYSNMSSWSRRFFVLSCLLIFCCFVVWTRTIFRYGFL